MCNPIFDYDDGDFIYQTSGNMGIDSDGDLHMRIGDNMSMDMPYSQVLHKTRHLAFVKPPCNTVPYGHYAS